MRKDVMIEVLRLFQTGEYWEDDIAKKTGLTTDQIVKLIDEYWSEVKFYHGTDKANVDSILTNGLLRSKSNFWKGCGGVIHLSLTHEMEFDKPFEAMFLVRPPFEGRQLNTWEFTAWEDIPPSQIQQIK